VGSENLSVNYILSGSFEFVKS